MKLDVVNIKIMWMDVSSQVNNVHFIVLLGTIYTASSALPLPHQEDEGTKIGIADMSIWD